jgi:NAD(P)-dependent dehydrogenase (short-subunit alcohol dehydrogenase family)
MRTWIITGVSSGFGYELTKQLLTKGERVIGTILKESDREKIGVFLANDNFEAPILDVTDINRTKAIVDDTAKKYGRIDVAISNAGYGLFGAAEELSMPEAEKIIATNLTGSIAFIKAVLPYMRQQGGGRIIQISSYGGQVAYPSNSLYHATKFGIEGFCESLAQEVAKYNIGVTIVEPGGARTEFRYSSAHVANLMPEYEHVHDFLNMLDKSKGLAPGDPAKMASRIIESVDRNPAPLRVVLGSQALKATIERLEERVADYKTQAELAASTDFTDGN